MKRIMKTYKKGGKRRFPTVPAWAERSIRGDSKSMLKYNLKVGKMSKETTDLHKYQLKKKKKK